jgi:sugar lactone lactonase YvrE
MSQSRVRRVLLLLLVAGVLSGTARASGPVFWTVASAAEFLRGTSDGVFVSRDGVVTAGPQTVSRLTATPAQVWSLAEGADGTLWAGTGGDGRVLRVRSGQAEEVAFDSGESNVFALAASGGRVYAATSPDGRIYVIEGSAPARPFFDPQEKYIWALAIGADGRLWVGAGNPAVIYRVDTNGNGQAVYKPPAAHVVSLARDQMGQMLAGTESPGRLYRFGSDDRPFVLLDSGLTEVRAAVAAPDGSIYVAAVSRGDEPAPSGGETASVGLAQPPPTTPPTTGSATSGRRSILFRIEPTGTWEPAWETTDIIYDIVAARDGGVLAATGPEGRLYRVESNRDVLLLTGVDARQITRFAGPPRPGARLAPFATANPGRVLSPGSGEQEKATYVSGVRDTKSVATWGLIRWESAGPVSLYTRSGNTERPDDSWSDWAGPYSRREGEAIKSPPARFLQWRAVLTRATAQPTASLTSVTVAYLGRNNRPMVTSVTVHPPGVVFQRPFSAEDGAIAGLDDLTADARRPPGDAGPPPPPPGRRMYQKGLQTFVWKAEDADADRLSYSLEYRREGDQTWHALRTGLTDAIAVWDTSTVADGRYIVRVTASDSLSNASDRALAGEKESEPVDVDNTPPAVTVEINRQAGGLRAVVRVQDAQSPIQKLEYSLAGGPWQLVYPLDGLADAPIERYEIPLAAEGDVARLMLRATDLLQNVTSAPARSKS